MGNAMASLVILAILVEVCVDIIKAALPFVKGYRSQLASVIIGVLLATATTTGLLAMLDVNISLTWVDYFLTGLIISRGSNFIHDLLAKLRFS